MPRFTKRFRMPQAMTQWFAGTTNSVNAKPWRGYQPFTVRLMSFTTVLTGQLDIAEVTVEFSHDPRGQEGSCKLHDFNALMAVQYEMREPPTEEPKQETWRDRPPLL